MGRHWWELTYPDETQPDERVALVRRVRERVTARRRRDEALDAWEQRESEREPQSEPS